MESEPCSRRFVAFSPFALKCGLRVKIRALGPNFQGSRFNGRPSVSKTESGGSNPSSPASLLEIKRAGNVAELLDSADGRSYGVKWPTRYAPIETKNPIA